MVIYTACHQFPSPPIFSWSIKCWINPHQTYIEVWLLSVRISSIFWPACFWRPLGILPTVLSPWQEGSCSDLVLCFDTSSHEHMDAYSYSSVSQFPSVWYASCKFLWEKSMGHFHLPSEIYVWYIISTKSFGLSWASSRCNNGYSYSGQRLNFSGGLSLITANN